MRLTTHVTPGLVLGGAKGEMVEYNTKSGMWRLGIVQNSYKGSAVGIVYLCNYNNARRKVVIVKSSDKNWIRAPSESIQNVGLTNLKCPLFARRQRTPKAVPQPGAEGAAKQRMRRMYDLTRVGDSTGAAADQPLVHAV